MEAFGRLLRRKGGRHSTAASTGSPYGQPQGREAAAGALVDVRPEILGVCGTAALARVCVRACLERGMSEREPIVIYNDQEGRPILSRRSHTCFCSRSSGDLRYHDVLVSAAALKHNARCGPAAFSSPRLSPAVCTASTCGSCAYPLLLSTLRARLFPLIPSLHRNGRAT